MKCLPLTYCSIDHLVSSWRAGYGSHVTFRNYSFTRGYGSPGQAWGYRTQPCFLFAMFPKYVSRQPPVPATMLSLPAAMSSTPWWTEPHWNSEPEQACFHFFPSILSQQWDDNRYITVLNQPIQEEESYREA